MIGRNESTPVPDHAREGRPTISEITVRKATPEEREKYGIGGENLSLTKEKLQSWVEQGMSVKEMATEAGLKENYIRVYASRHKIKLHRMQQEKEDHTKEQAPEPAQDYGKDLDGKTGYYTAATRADRPEEKTDVQEEIKEEMERRLQLLPDKPKSDIISHPSHYTDGKIEVIDFIEDKQLNFHRGNVVKYVSRAGKKDKTKEIEDLRKAQWYLGREISRMEGTEGEK